MNDYSFREKHNISVSQGRTKKDIDILYKCFPNAFYIVPYLVDSNDFGVDYIVAMKDKTVKYVDAKHREAGVSRYWETRVSNGNTVKVPELTLEIMSVREKGIKGWLLDETKLSDYILFTYDESDSAKSYLFERDPLRETFKRNLNHWIDTYGEKCCTSNGGAYTTTSVYVPVPEVIREYDKTIHESIIIQESTVEVYKPITSSEAQMSIFSA